MVRSGKDAVGVARQVEDWMRRTTDEVWFGTGLKT